MKQTKTILIGTIISGALALQGSIANAQGNSTINRSPDASIRSFKVPI